MPLDSIAIQALTSELADRIVGGKIDKVQQPERDLVLLTVRGNGENMRLVLSGGVGNARLHLTEASYENPQQPPMFCMLLRKHLVGARISGLRQPDGERMAVLELDGFDEMGVPVKKQLVLEMIGRNTNLILVGEDGIIIDCLRKVDSDMSMKRQVLPGLIYRLPPVQDRADFFALDSAGRRELILQADPEKPLDKHLTGVFSRLSPLVARELCYRAFEDASPKCALAQENIGDFTLHMDAFAEMVIHEEFLPCLFTDGDRPMDFSFMVIDQYGASAQCEILPGFSQLLDAFYTRRDKAENMRKRSANLMKMVRTTRDRTARKLANQLEELKTTAQREEKRKCGDLITANLYRMKKGESSVVVQDYYEEGCPDLTIELDPLKTPQQNAAAYYKEYTKAKKAEQHLTELIEVNQRDLEYLSSVMDEIQRAEAESDLGEIRRELMETGYIRQQKNGKKEKVREQKPMRFVSSTGFEILVGRSNRMNDQLTTKMARRTDLWLHTQKIHGSHVIVSAGGGEVDEQTIAEAAALAAYYSQAREGGKVPVDYTQVRFVKKPGGSLPGMVIYTDYKTVIAEADEKLAERLRVKG